MRKKEMAEVLIEAYRKISESELISWKTKVDFEEAMECFGHFIKDSEPSAVTVDIDEEEELIRVNIFSLLFEGGSVFDSKVAELAEIAEDVYISAADGDDILTEFVFHF